MFKKLFTKPPEIPEEMDFLATSNEKMQTSLPESASKEELEKQGNTEGIGAKREAKEAYRKDAKHFLPRVLASSVLFIAVAVGVYWFLSVYNAPVPAQIPEGDILASLISSPSAVPAQSTVPQSEASQKSEPENSAQTENPSLANDTTVQTPVQEPAQKPQPTASAASESKQETVMLPAQDVASGIFGSNPFIDLSSLRSIVSASAGAMELPRFGANRNMALPDVPRPAVSPDLIPSPGEIRTPAGPVGSAAAAPSMGGLIKSADGSAIAIMGDGTVLSEGDTYKGDRRVTFIGGDGITFDDGNSIAFGGQNKTTQ